MYGLPKDLDLSVFINKEIEEITFTVNTIVFCFGIGLSITTESIVEFFYLKDGSCCCVEPPVESSNLMMLLGKKIVNAIANPNGKLELAFDDGMKLGFLDDSSQYESYRINIDGKEIVV